MEEGFASKEIFVSSNNSTLLYRKGLLWQMMGSFAAGPGALAGGFVTGVISYLGELKKNRSDHVKDGFRILIEEKLLIPTFVCGVIAYRMTEKYGEM